MSISIDTFPKSLEMHWGVFVNKIKTKVICNWTPTFRMKDMQLTDKPRKRLKTLPRLVHNLLDWKLLMLGDAVQPVELQLLLARVSFTWFIFVQPGDDAVPLHLAHTTIKILPVQHQEYLEHRISGS